METAQARSQPESLDLRAVVLTGQLAGLIMAGVVMLVFTLFLGKGPLFPVQVIGSFIYGDSALEGIQLKAIVAGLILHQLGPALLWSLVFGGAIQLLRIERGPGLLAVGAVVGLLSQIVDVNLLLPPLMRAWHGHDIWAEQVPALWSWAAHLVFGLALGLYPVVQQKIKRQ